MSNRFFRPTKKSAGAQRSAVLPLCTPGMGVNLWGASPLYVNPVNVKSSWTLTKVLAEGKGEIVR
ncbi:MAG: hypothetical protein ABFD06_12665, partial [Smithella sp.]